MIPSELEKWQKPITTPMSECDDILLVVCQILLWDEEQILKSTFYFKSILQEADGRENRHWNCVELIPLSLLTVKLV